MTTPDGVACEIAQSANQNITKKSLRKRITTFKILNKIDKQKEIINNSLAMLLLSSTSKTSTNEVKDILNLENNTTVIHVFAFYL